MAQGGSLEGTPGHCVTDNEYNGDMGLRISSIFVILVGSALGAVFPLFIKRNARESGRWFIFFAKFFGSGIILATAFIHLLAPAHEALSDGCLTGPITEYSWVEGICLMTTFSLFVFEFVAMKISHDRGGGAHVHDHGSSSTHEHHHSDEEAEAAHKSSADFRAQRAGSQLPGEDHLGHSREHTDNVDVTADWTEPDHAGTEPEQYAAQTLSFYVLEGGVIFHSIFIGLTLAVSGEEFRTLYVVLVFHQTFEGLGLGSRLTAIPWPKSKRWMPYLLGLAYGFSTPLAIAIGLGVRNSYAPGSQTALVTNGVFDSISAGILIYTALVELMAHEFMFSTEMMKASWKTCGLAIGYMCLGAGLMALLGNWA